VRAPVKGYKKAAEVERQVNAGKAESPPRPKSVERAVCPMNDLELLIEQTDSGFSFVNGVKRAHNGKDFLRQWLGWKTNRGKWTYGWIQKA
jgi:hypothetical protein